MELIWVVVLGFCEVFDILVQGCFVYDSLIVWLVCNCSKLGCDIIFDIWVLYVISQWSWQYIDMVKEDVVEYLCCVFVEVIGCVVLEVVFSIVYCWFYVCLVEVYQWGVFSDFDLGIYVCGDWCFSGCVEGVWFSGQEVVWCLLEYF